MPVPVHLCIQGLHWFLVDARHVVDLLANLHQRIAHRVHPRLATNHHVDIQERQIRLEAVTKVVEIQKTGNGVLVGQGGTAHGYALFIRKGKPVFAFRRNNKLTEVVGTKALGEGPVRVAGRVDAKGALQLLVDGKLVGSGQAAGTLTQVPQDGLEVGRDNNGNVGRYESPNPFTGTIDSASLTLE